MLLESEPVMSKAIDELLSVFTYEQLQQLAQLSMQLKERAEMRKCEQTLEISFNAKGRVRYFNGSDNVSAIMPEGYKAE